MSGKVAGRETRCALASVPAYGEVLGSYDRGSVTLL